MEIIKLGQKIAKADKVQSVHYENINGKDYLFIIFKDWKKGGKYITLDQARQIVK